MNIFKSLLLSGIILFTVSCASNPAITPQPAAEAIPTKEVPFVVVLEHCDEVKYVFVEYNNKVVFADNRGLRANYEGAFDFFIEAVTVLSLLDEEPHIMSLTDGLGLTCL